MPLYDVRCKKCGVEIEITCSVSERDSYIKNDDLFHHCQDPDGHVRTPGKMEFLITCVKNRDWFRPFIQDDFDGSPVEVKSKKHYRELCKKHGVTARCL